jgi:sulfate adenylyltransferase subunit 2
LTPIWETAQIARVAELSAFLDRAEAYAKAAGLTPNYVSLKILNDGKGLSRLRNGGTITLRTLETAEQRLDELERALGADSSPPEHAA